MSNEMLVLIPTYNERDNVIKMNQRIFQLNISVDILFIDDNSPDGTGEILDKISKTNVFVLHRSGKLGIGSAHKDGIAWAYSHGYSSLITMDSDFLHRPEDIPLLLEQSKYSDIVTTSRFIRGDSLSEWSLWRKFLTISGHIITKFLLNMPYDVTGAFRLYNLDKIPKDLFENVISNGYSFFPESLVLLKLNKFSISEVPVVLPQRTYGSSKLKFRDMVQWLLFIIKLWYLIAFKKESFLHRHDDR
jgi:dolichol-phosphate mannosyltransferase